MQLFTGTKTIKARPMTLGHYNIYRDWTQPRDEDPQAEGYLVGYPDAHGLFDGPLEEGCHYLAWSPADVFEATYRPDPHPTSGGQRFRLKPTGEPDA